MKANAKCHGPVFGQTDHIFLAKVYINACILKHSDIWLLFIVGKDALESGIGTIKLLLKHPCWPYFLITSSQLNNTITPDPFWHISKRHLELKKKKLIT